MKRNKHSLSHYRLSTLNQGVLYPIAALEVLPGDSFRHMTSMLLRVSPLVSPVMHPVNVSIHHWYVPARLLWDKWEAFITGKDRAAMVPTISFNITDDPLFTKLAQALGVGIQTKTTDVTVASLIFRAYNLIWNEFYRDQNLSASISVPVNDGPDDPASFQLKNVSWQKDYFTTSRPYPQQGTDTAAVQLSLSGSVPVKGLAVASGAANVASGSALIDGDGSTLAAGTRVWGSSAPNIVDAVNSAGSAGTGGHRPNLRADLSQLSGSINMDINQWRIAMATQRMREHRNRFGERYTDLLAFLGIRASDARLQRPEYLGGGRSVISFSEVLSTADTATAPLGSLGGHGISALRTAPYKRFFEEHGYMISLAFVRPETVYVNKVPRHYLRRQYDHYWQKELEMLGEQAITNFEVYADSATPSGTFGYIPRYDEYRFNDSFVTGEFRDILDYWHMARVFDTQPVLNESFVTADPTDRIYASTDTDQLYAMISHRISARRLVSKRARA